MKIAEFISIAEEFYNEDKETNEENSVLGIIKFHEEIALKYYSKTREIKEYNLTEVELLSIIMLEGGGCTVIQEAAFFPNRQNLVTSVLLDSLDNALFKIPRNKEKTLYRNDNYNNKNYVVGQQFQIMGYFSTSIDDYDNAKYIKWIITPLDSNRTKAHEIYRVFNHGENLPYPELQVEFERGTIFEVTAIENCDSIRVIHISEIQT